MSINKGKKTKKIVAANSTSDDPIAQLAAHPAVAAYMPDASLYCSESLGPPGVERDYQATHPVNLELEASRYQVGRRRRIPINMDLNAEDVKLVNDLGQLTTEQLADYIRIIQANAYAVAVDEARQISKGKVLQIFKKPIELEEDKEKKTNGLPGIAALPAPENQQQGA